MDSFVLGENCRDSLKQNRIADTLNKNGGGTADNSEILLEAVKTKQTTRCN